MLRSANGSNGPNKCPFSRNLLIVINCHYFRSISRLCASVNGISRVQLSPAGDRRLCAGCRSVDFTRTVSFTQSALVHFALQYCNACMCYTCVKATVVGTSTKLGWLSTIVVSSEHLHSIALLAGQCAESPSAALSLNNRLIGVRRHTMRT